MGVDQSTLDVTKTRLTQILRLLTYTNPSIEPTLTPRTITVILADPFSAGPAVSTDLAITPINQVPVLSVTNPTLAYTEGDSPVLVSNDATITDADNSNMASATVTITGAFQALKDQLACTSAVVPCSFDAASGVLTLSGSFPIATYQVT